MSSPAGIETFGNQPYGSVTSGGTTTSDTAFTVTPLNNSSWPAAQATNIPHTFFRFTDVANTSEIMIATTAPGGSGAGQSWTVSRAQEGTAGIAHTSPWTCRQLISAGTMQNLKQSPAAATSAVTVNNTTETALAVYLPVDSLAAGNSYETVAFGSMQKLGGATTGTLTFRLRWGWVNSGTPGTAVTSLVTGTNGPAIVTTVAAGSSFDVNGTLTLIDSTHAVGNLNFWNMTSATATATYVASSGSSTVISGSGPLALTAQWSSTANSQSLTAVAPMVYRAA